MKRRTEMAAARAKPRKGRAKRSAYATKVASGRQMYGPGCCAHTRVVSRRVAREYEGPSLEDIERYSKESRL
jgi:hypothetical protein